MAEAAVLAGLNWVASSIVSNVIKDASTYLGMDMAQELEELETTILPQFQLVIEAAEKSPHKSKLEKWLRALKAAFHEAEDLLDEHEYQLLKREVKRGNKMTVRSTSNHILKPFHKVSSKLRNLLPQNRKLLYKLLELKDILAKAKDFRELLGVPAAGSSSGSGVANSFGAPINTTSHPTSKVFGRDTVRDQIIDLLLEPVSEEASEAGYSALAIVAHGGAGKTTLAQYVYNDERVRKHFDVKMWVCISRKLDVSRHTKEMIESASKGECPRLDNLDTLQCKLKDMLLPSKKFLLVLDDIWFDESESEMEWEQLLAPLHSTRRGSQILVTSRSKTLPAALRCREFISLEDMKEAEYLRLFKHHAFPDIRNPQLRQAEVRNPQLRQDLEVIGAKIAAKLRRSPLAAKALGNQLSKNFSVDVWRAALANDKLSKTTKEALLWSYQHLHPSLQRCFLYCSLFPKGYKYEIDGLRRDLSSHVIRAAA